MELTFHKISKQVYDLRKKNPLTAKNNHPYKPNMDIYSVHLDILKKKPAKNKQTKTKRTNQNQEHGHSMMTDKCSTVNITNNNHKDARNYGI